MVERGGCGSEWASDLNDSECQNEIFRMAKQMVKERQDITRLNCIKGASGKVIVDDKRDQRLLEGVHGETDE